MLKPSAVVLGLFTAFSGIADNAATAQTMRDDGNINLKQSCADLVTSAGRTRCQQDFSAVAEAFRVRQNELASAPHYVSYGSVDDPVTVMVTKPGRDAYAIMEGVNGACLNIHLKKTRDPQSGRLDDGSETGTLRIAERAKICAETALFIADVTKMPVDFAIAAHILKNAGYVIPRVNRIAHAQTGLAVPSRQ